MEKDTSESNPTELRAIISSRTGKVIAIGTFDELIDTMRKTTRYWMVDMDELFEYLPPGHS